MIPKQEASSKPSNTAAIAGEGISEIHLPCIGEAASIHAVWAIFNAVIFGERMKARSDTTLALLMAS
jgi:hypothetical protein